jgi:EmrB/QacA subfamily drug resistance transporter
MLAPAIGPTFSGWLLQNWSWPWLFWMNVPIGIVAIIMVARYIPYYRLNVPKSFDLTGLITVVLSSSSILVSLSQGHAWGWSSWKTVSLLVFGLVTLVLFVWRELKAETPLLNLRVLQNGRYSLTLIITCIVTISLYSGTFLTPVFLQNIQRVTPLDTGLILLPASLAMAIVMPFVGKLYGSIGPRALMIAGIVLIAAGSLPLSWLSVDVPHGYILFWMIVRNVGIALTMMPASNAGMEQISPELSGHASSLSNWLRNVFGSFAIAVFTTILASRSATHATEMVASGMTDKASIQMMSFTLSVNDVYLVATIIALAALPLSLFVRSKGVKPNVSASVGKTEVAEA